MRNISDTPVNNKNAAHCNPPRQLASDDVSSPMSRRVKVPADPTTDMDQIIAQELHNLSLKDRNRVYEEIHGVAERLQEDPELVAQRLSQFNLFLFSEIRNKSAYSSAFQQSPEYVNDPAFRLMFLRSTDFDAYRAAQKVVDHFELKLELFGFEKLARNITLDDLDQKDLECLKSGMIQILPIKDRAGRPIFFARPMMHDEMRVRKVYSVRKCMV
jgi:hypothetical protein